MPKSRGKWRGQHLVLEDEVTVYTAASTALTNYGVSVCTTQGVYTLEAPSSGCHARVIVCGTTKTVKIVTGESAYINSTDSDTISVAHSSAGSVDMGVVIDLYGYSTAKWYCGIGSNTRVLTSGAAGAMPAISISSAT